MNAHEIKDIHSIFVFVDTDPTEDVEAMNRILAIDEVKDIYVVSGQYDLLVVLELRRSWDGHLHLNSGASPKGSSENQED
jgi:DNA-binding Lrp family transcriptional regulator